MKKKLLFCIQYKFNLGTFSLYYKSIIVSDNFGSKVGLVFYITYNSGNKLIIYIKYLKF
jgi:hypothetical protein